jgi:hypothetical protein
MSVLFFAKLTVRNIEKCRFVIANTVNQSHEAVAIREIAIAVRASQ